MVIKDLPTEVLAEQFRKENHSYNSIEKVMEDYDRSDLLDYFGVTEQVEVYDVDGLTETMEEMGL